MAGCLIDSIQRFVATTSVGASTVRGSPRGTADKARAFLTKLQLQQFGVEHESEFQWHLDEATKQLKKRLPRGRRDWALSRKILNIFLRYAFYNHYLRKQYNLHLAESLFEVPIDSVVAKELRKAFPRKTFSPWPGLKELDPKRHAEYQDRAKVLAHKCGIARVHLDAVLWVQGRGENRSSDTA